MLASVYLDGELQLMAEEVQHILLTAHFDGVRIPGDHLLGEEGRGFTYLRMEQFDRAILDFNAALKVNPGLASALYGRGMAKLKKGETESAAADMAAAAAMQANVANEVAGYGVK